MLTIALLLVDVVGAGVGLAPTTDTPTLEAGPQPTMTAFFDDNTFDFEDVAGSQVGEVD